MAANRQDNTAEKHKIPSQMTWAEFHADLNDGQGRDRSVALHSPANYEKHICQQFQGLLPIDQNLKYPYFHAFKDIDPKNPPPGFYELTGISYNEGNYDGADDIFRAIVSLYEANFTGNKNKVSNRAIHRALGVSDDNSNVVKEYLAKRGIKLSEMKVLAGTIGTARMKLNQERDKLLQNAQHPMTKANSYKLHQIDLQLETLKRKEEQSCEELKKLGGRRKNGRRKSTNPETTASVTATTTTMTTTNDISSLFTATDEESNAVPVRLIKRIKVLRSDDEAEDNVDDVQDLKPTNTKKRTRSLIDSEDDNRVDPVQDSNPNEKELNSSSSNTSSQSLFCSSTLFTSSVNSKSDIFRKPKRIRVIGSDDEDNGNVNAVSRDTSTQSLFAAPSKSQSTTTTTTSTTSNIDNSMKPKYS